jgi:hypothetical protein
VAAGFTDTINSYRYRASTLTDDGSVYISRFTHGHNEFEDLLASVKVTQKNGHPGLSRPGESGGGCPVNGGSDRASVSCRS